jgi:hypothetical protein
MGNLKPLLPENKHKNPLFLNIVGYEMCPTPLTQLHIHGDLYYDGTHFVIHEQSGESLIL